LGARGRSVAVCRSTTVGMLLAGPNAALRGKLTEKVKYRPTAAIEPLLTSGGDGRARRLRKYCKECLPGTHAHGTL